MFNYTFLWIYFLFTEKEESFQFSQSQSSINVLESLPSSRKSSVSMQSESPLTPLTPKSADASSFNDALGTNKATEPLKKRNVIDAMPRSARDLQRSTVAIARFHAVHEDVRETSIYLFTWNAFLS